MRRALKYIESSNLLHLIRRSLSRIPLTPHFKTNWTTFSAQDVSRRHGFQEIQSLLIRTRPLRIRQSGLTWCCTRSEAGFSTSFWRSTTATCSFASRSCTTAQPWPHSTFSTVVWSSSSTIRSKSLSTVVQTLLRNSWRSSYTKLRLCCCQTQLRLLMVLF